MIAARSMEPAPTPSQLNAMTKAHLLVVADQRGVDGLSDRNTKAEMIAALGAV